MKKLGIIVFSLLFIISSGILASIYVMKSIDTKSIDPQYATAVFDEDIKTQEYEFDEFNRLYFLHDRDPITSFTKKTSLLGTTPTLKIVNSNDYRVEITTNADVFDKLKIATYSNEDNPDYVSLTITFTDDCYIPVHTDDSSYDYDTGLYVDFDKFDVTVYAPISSIFVDSEIIFDYEAPKCEKMTMHFAYEGTEGVIHHINTDYLSLYCSGTSNIMLSGEVHEKSSIYIWHNSKIDISDLETKAKDFRVSSALFGEFSYIKDNHIYDIGLLNLDNLPVVILASIFYLPPVLWLACLISCIRSKKKAKM